MGVVRVKRKWKFRKLEKIFKRVGMMACKPVVEVQSNNRALKIYWRFAYANLAISLLDLIYFVFFVAKDLVEYMYYGKLCQILYSYS